MLKRLLLGLAIASQAALFCPLQAQASSGDIGGEPVRAISPIPSYGFTQTFINPYGFAPSVVVVTPGSIYNRIYPLPIHPYPFPVIINPPIVTPVPYPYYYNKPDCSLSGGKPLSLSSGTISGCW